MNALTLSHHDPIDTLDKHAGGKATNLARLQKCKVPVPEWFCLSTLAFKQFLEQFGHMDLWKLGHKEVEDTFIKGKIDLALLTAIQEQLSKLPSGTYAVRSSGVGEDSAQNSFAGQFSSYLHQKTLEQIIHSVKLCWASAFTERAQSYRHERKISTQNFGMGVVIQRMIEASSSGVAFSRDPIHPLKREQMIVSSVFGLGEGLVSGELDADHFYVKRPENSGKVTYESHVVQKDHYFIKNVDGGISKQDVADELKNSSSLDDDQINKIVEALILLEDALGLPQDIEFAFEAASFYCVQTRPITTLPPKSFFDKSVMGEQYILWDNSNITESYCGVTSPLTFSHISRSYRQVYIQFCEVMGVPPKLIKKHEITFRNMLGLIRGHVYYNLGNWYQMIFLFPNAENSSSFMDTMMGVKQGLKPEIAALFDFTKNPPGYSFFRKTYIIGMNLWRIFKVKTIIKNFRRDFDRVYLAAKNVNYSEKNIQQLIDAYNSLNEDLLFKWKAPLISDTRCMVFFGTLKSLTEKWIKVNSNTSLYNDLLSGQGDLPSTEPTRLLMKMAKKVTEGDPHLKEWFITNESKVVLEGFKNGKYPDVYQDFKKFIDLYGFRCINELKLESTDLHEDPLFAIEAIISFVKMKNISVAEIEEREKINSQKAEKVVTDNLSGVKLWIYNFILRHARTAVRDREELRLLRTNIFGICRRIFKALGQRFYELEIIAEPMDIFYLSVEEIVAYQEGRSFEVSFLELTRTRKKQFDEYRTSPPPPDRFVTEGAASLNFLYPQVMAEQDLMAGTEPVSDDPNVLIGTPCCPGIVEGIVRVVREAKDAENLQGEIMVSERTDPGWVPLFPSTSGLLIERGSLLSHSAVVARELGIPTIVGIHGGLLKKLKTGMRVRMDASKGEIRILE